MLAFVIEYSATSIQTVINEGFCNINSRRRTSRGIDDKFLLQLMLNCDLLNVLENFTGTALKEFRQFASHSFH